MKGIITMRYTERQNRTVNANTDLLEFLQSALRCMYLSDLRTEAYNGRAKELLSQLALNSFPAHQVRDAYSYLYA